MSRSERVLPPGFMTAGQAIKRIGVSRYMFYKLVGEGKIEGVMLPGRAEAVYREYDADRLTKTYQLYAQDSGDTQLHFDVALVEDIPAIRKMLLAFYGRESHVLPEEVMRGWMRRNPQCQHIMRRGTQIVGYMALFPMPDEAIEKRLTAVYWNRTIPMESVLPFIPDSTVKVYIAEMIVDQTLPIPDPKQKLAEERKLGMRLIRFATDFLIQLGQDDRIYVEEVYAVGTSPAGIRLCQDMKMIPMVWLPEGVREDRVPFKDVTAISESRLLKRYRLRLRGA